MPSMTIGPLSATPGNGFKEVLTRLVSDRNYLLATTANPRAILSDFPTLSVQDLQALRDAAVLSGVDMSNISPLNDGLTIRPLGDIGCCCCCCCGVTGAVIHG